MTCATCRYYYTVRYRERRWDQARSRVGEATFTHHLCMRSTPIHPPHESDRFVGGFHFVMDSDLLSEENLSRFNGYPQVARGTVGCGNYIKQRQRKGK